MKTGRIVQLTFPPLRLALLLMGVVVVVVVDGQLYTVLEDLAIVHGLPLFNVLNNNPSTPANAPPTATRRTCMARFQDGWGRGDWGDVDLHRNTEVVIETFAISRHSHASTQVRYFCSNFPTFREYYGNPWDATQATKYYEDRVHSPYSLFWLNEPTAISWHRRLPAEGGRTKGLAWQAAKDQGLIFRVDVTGIKSRGRFLKGWYHLKVMLDIDQNYNGTGDFTTQRGLFVIDKLMVTARGRILIPTNKRTRNNGSVYQRPLRRGWVGGIGEFVKDFPKCDNEEYNNDHVVQQFMPCGAVQYAESTHGNNFYYTRTDNSRYGQPYGSARKSNVDQEIHINFRLDNSFCNRYYDLDFVANGIALRRDPGKQFKTKEWKADPTVLNNIVYIVLRSISTRFLFASSYAHHGPTFYENADPIPRGVNSVICNAALASEWTWNTGDLLDPKSDKHRMSITKGADLVVSKSSPDATFGGAIKFIFNVPPSLATNYLDKYGTLNKTESAAFASRRTSTAADKLFTYPYGYGSDNLHTNPYDHWKDYKTFESPVPSVGSDYRTLQQQNMVVDIQRVLNEFDWETWVEQTSPGPDRCIGYPAAQDAKVWPHPYYDITCGGELVRADYDPPDYKPNPITGRCRTTRWSTFGSGDFKIPTPRCDEFFSDTDTKDPALLKIKETVNSQISSSTVTDRRSTWNERYEGNEIKQRSNVICEIQEQLQKEYPECPTIPPRPHTLRPISKDQELRAKAAFKKTKAYKRGMLVSESPYTLVIWDARLIHGVFMTIIVMFVTPVSFFLTRYFKETFMNSRIMLLHVWYIVHIFAAIFTPLFYMLALWRLIETRPLLGLSLTNAASGHRVIGWMTVAFATILIMFGGFRFMNRQLRAASIIIHWAFGFLFYILCLSCMFTSIYIPGSPGAYHDHSLNQSGGKFLKEAVGVVTVLWIVFELGMHAAMTVVQCLNDKKMRLTQPRLYFPSPMPVIRETFRFDTPGRFFRINMLRAYVAVSLLATVTICTFMLNYSPRGRGFGFMSCTHEKKDNDVREVATDKPC